MFILSANVKQVAAGNTIGTVVENVQTVAAPDHHQLGEFMGMLSKDILWIAVSHRHGLRRAGKKIGFSKN